LIGVTHGGFFFLGGFLKTTITINGWDKFNPRKDVRAASWFRLEHGFIEDPDFFDFSIEEKFCWIYLLSIAAKKRGSTFLLNANHAIRVCGIKRGSLDSALQKLQELQIIAVGVTDTLRERTATNVRTDERTIPQIFDLESLYSNYPRKEGKKKGLQIAKSQIKDLDQFKKLEMAITNYGKKISIEKIEPKFIKHFDTFMNCWTDYLELQTTKPSGQKNIDYSHLIENRDL
jgi:hypothetical protein